MAISIPIISEFDGKGVQKAIAQFKQLETSGEKAQFALKKAAAPAAAALGAFGLVASDAVKAASDLGEATSKVGVLFGQGARDVEEFAKQASKIGLSRRAALEAAGTFGTFGRVAGKSGKELAKFSNDFSGLAADLASFNNATPEEVIQALGSALRGEAEPMRRFGVLLSADALAAQALKIGIADLNVDSAKLASTQVKQEKAQLALNKAIKEHGVDSIEAREALAKYEVATENVGKALKGKMDKLTDEQKVLAAQSLIYEQTAAAQGDFARTQEGLANSQRILAAEFANLKVSLGEELLPVIQELLPYIKDFAAWARDNPEVFKAIAGTIAAIAASTVALNLAMAANPYVIAAAGIIALAVAFERLGDAYSKAQGAVKFLLGVANVGAGLLVPGGLGPAIGNLFDFGGSKSVPRGGGLNIPKMANGGIVTGPTLALIGEAGPEAVVPLNRAGGMGGVTINVNGGDPEAVVNALRRYMNRYGNIPIRTTAP
jgi:hypothetical protein